MKTDSTPETRTSGTVPPLSASPCSAMRCGKPATVDCTDCGWQGTWVQTDAMLCPDCGAECEEYDAEKDSPNAKLSYPEQAHKLQSDVDGKSGRS